MLRFTFSYYLSCVFWWFTYLSKFPNSFYFPLYNTMFFELEPPYSALHKNPTFLGFSYKMPIHARVENYLNVMLNPPIFSTTARTNVGSVSMSFGCKISNNLKLINLVWKFAFSTLMACNSRTTWARKTQYRILQKMATFQEKPL